MHVRIIMPVITEEWLEGSRENYARFARPSTEVSAVLLDWGTASIETYRDEALVVPDVMTKVAEAEKDGVDAVIIDCMGDPGLTPAREVVDIPVVGPAEASMHLAAMLGHRFSVLVLFESNVVEVERQAASYGLSGCLASSRPFNVPVLDLDTDPESTLEAVIAAAELAVVQDGAHVLVPGCTGLAGWAPRIQAGLAERGCEVPVLDPPTVAMKVAESLVDMGLSHSKRTYPAPREKEIRWPWATPFTG